MTPSVIRIALPWAVQAAASDGTTVWCAGDGHLRVHTASGTFVADGAVPAGLRSLAAVPGTVPVTAGVPGTLTGTVVVPRSLADPPPAEADSLSGTLAGADGEHVHWLAAACGTPLAKVPFRGRVQSGCGEIWAVGDGGARRLVAPGRLGDLVDLPGLDRCAIDGRRLWWTSRHDTLLRGGPRTVDLDQPKRVPRERATGRRRRPAAGNTDVTARKGARRADRGAMTVCAGSLWISVPDGLVRVSAWSGEPRRRLKVPAGPVPFLVCANGVLVGGGARELFVLNPLATRTTRLRLDAPLAHLVPAGKHVWAFPANRPEALIIPV
ncbi:hypothetical protein HII36_47500 [Nonomuraea sp. NN258]|uniref:hypothetical protein n=1 Tax=Nonomuraea antri TaxID=2730852 RepID=UPI001569CF65|nr:hypothetical protein [Nonomuraea antri]NRQ39422.1 hypothetical protein [Nonomuraea antri]